MRAIFAVALIGIAAIFSGCDRTHFVQKSNAMLPTIAPGQEVVAEASADKEIKRWDLVVLRIPAAAPGLAVLRVVGLPEEDLQLTDDGATIRINGNMISSPPGITYLSPGGAIGQLKAVDNPFHIPPGEYFVLGDNSTNALDSRVWGSIPRKEIVGLVKSIR